MDKKIDESWKEQVELERQRSQGSVPPSGERGPASPAEKPRPESVPSDGGRRPSKGGSPPSTDFGLFLSSLSMQAMMALGELPHPVTGQVQEDLEQARYLIDTLGMLQEKTQGNLTPEEQALLEGVLYELRMKYMARTGGGR